MNTQSTHREAVPPMPNRLGLAGIEFIEYATSRPQALGQVLEIMGFRPIARHRSREVTLYRQGEMNIVVNAHPEDARVTATADGQPVISAVAFRVHDALKAYTQCMDLGAWHVDSHAQAMELHIPAIHGPGGSRFYFVDRWQEFSIYDIDFKAIPAVDLHPPAIAGMNFFGVVQYIGESRSADWIAYYQHMFDLQVVPDNLRFGIMPKGKLLKSPCGSFLWQLIEPDPSMDADESIEYLQRIGLGTPHVAQAIIELKKRGVNFVESSELHPEDRGALTQSVLGSVLFELVHQDKQEQVMNVLDGFGMDTITMAGSLEAKLAAMKQAGFSQVMLMARDLVGHPHGVSAAVAAVRASGLRPTGFQVLRDFEGLSGHLHGYKVDIARSMLQMCVATGSRVLLACSSTSQHATDDLDQIAQDLKKLAMMALPLGINVAYEGLSWGRTVNEFTVAWDVVRRADCPNLGIGIDSFHIFAAKSDLNAICDIDAQKIFLVQLSDFMWHDTPTFEDRMTTARTFRVFPGEGVHSESLAELVLTLDQIGYTGDYSFEVFNDDYQQMPLELVAQRARKSAIWLRDSVLHCPAPLPEWVKN